MDSVTPKSKTPNNMCHTPYFIKKIKNCLIAKGPTLHLFADFSIMTSQSNGQSNGCLIVKSYWNEVKKATLTD